MRLLLFLLAGCATTPDPVRTRANAELAAARPPSRAWGDFAEDVRLRLLAADFQAIARTWPRDSIEPVPAEFERAPLHGSMASDAFHWSLIVAPELRWIWIERRGGIAGILERWGPVNADAVLPGLREA